jgi:TatD DNase family protein
MGLIDAHCHLDRCSDPLGAARTAAQAGIVVVAVTESPSRYIAAARLFAGRSNIRVAIGLHPMQAIRSSRADLRVFVDQMQKVDYVGEVGLDYSPAGRASKAAQQRVFDELLAAPTAQEKVWTIHSRRAEQDVIQRIETARINAILHWYSGPVGLISRATAAGAYFSVNHAMLSSTSGQRIIASIPRDRILTETDAPYVTSFGSRGSPTDVSSVMDRLARKWGLDRAEASAQVFANMSAIFARARAPKDPTNVTPNIAPG